METQDGYIGYILSYKPNEQWYNNCINENGLLNLDMSNYQGDIIKYSLDRDIIWTTELENKNYQITECTFSLTIWCDESWNDGDIEPHIATSQCTNPEHLYSVWNETCETVYVGGSSDESDNGNTNGGTSSGQDDDCNDVSGTKIVAEQPLNGIGTGCATNNTISIQPDAEAEGRRRECRKITNQLNNKQNLRTKLNNLKATTSQDHENSISIFEEGDDVYLSGIPGFGGIDIPATVPSPYIAYAHTHDSQGVNGNGTLSVFSMADLISYADILDKDNLDASEFVAYLSTDDGTDYALTISSATKFKKLFFAFLGAGQDRDLDSIGVAKYYNSHNKVEKLNDIYYSPENPARKLKVDSDEPQTDLKEFLKFIEESDMGVTMFETTDNFNTFQKVSLSSNDSIKRESCN